MTKQGGRVGPGNRNEVGVCVSVASVNQVSTRGDSQPGEMGPQSPEWACLVAHAALPHVPGLQCSGVGTLECRCGSIPMFS